MVTQQSRLPIEGMTCASCAATIEGALRKKRGVISADVNIATEKATLQFDPAQVRLSDLVSTVRDVGYDVAIERITLPIGGMTCASCASHVEGALKGLEGVLSASVNLATEKATVEYVPGVVGLGDLKRAVVEVGYEVLELEVAEEEIDEEERKISRARQRMVVAWGFTIPIILWMLYEMFTGIAWPNRAVFGLGMIVVALPVLFWVGWPTYRSAWSSVTHGAANMDVLISIGTGVSLLTRPGAGCGSPTLVTTRVPE